MIASLAHITYVLKFYVESYVVRTTSMRKNDFAWDNEDIYMTYVHMLHKWFECFYDIRNIDI